MESLAAFPMACSSQAELGGGGILVFKEGRRSLLALEHGQKEATLSD